MNEPNFPTPEELQKKLTDFMKTQFGSHVSISTQVAPEPDEVASDEPAEAPDAFSFTHLPRDIKAHLDRFVIEQDEAKKVLSIAVCDLWPDLLRAGNTYSFQLARTRRVRISRTRSLRGTYRVERFVLPLGT